MKLDIDLKKIDRYDDDKIGKFYVCNLPNNVPAAVFRYNYLN